MYQLLSVTIYGLLRTFQFVPSGIVAWLTLALGVAAFVAGIWLMIKHAIEGRKRRRAGLPVRIVLWPILLYSTAVALFVSSSVSLMWWREMQQPHIRKIDTGKYARLGPQQQLHSALRYLEEKGVFTWFRPTD